MTDREHPSYGIIGFTRAQGTERPLFGESIPHHQLIVMEVSQGRLERIPGQNLYLSGDLILRAVMAPSQFSDAITKLNQGGGTPVTLEYVLGDTGKRGDPPQPNVAREFQAEMEQSLQGTMEALDQAILDSRGRMKRDLSGIRDRLRNSIPWLVERFSHQMNETVNEARAEIESFISQREREAGIRTLRGDEPLRMLPQGAGQRSGEETEMEYLTTAPEGRAQEAARAPAGVEMDPLRDLTQADGESGFIGSGAELERIIDEINGFLEEHGLEPPVPGFHRDWTPEQASRVLELASDGFFWEGPHVGNATWETTREGWQEMVRRYDQAFGKERQE